MRGRFSFLALLLIPLAACPDSAPPGADSGTLAIEQTEPNRRSLLKADARARYCDRDSTLTIVAVSDPWSVAIALRTAWPPATQFTIDSTRRTIGLAGLALRRVERDTVGPAVITHSGTIELDTGTTIAGRIDARAGFDSLASRYTGRFAVTRTDPNGCGVP